jgi:hypothetical protein
LTDDSTLTKELTMQNTDAANAASVSPAERIKAGLAAKGMLREPVKAPKKASKKVVLAVTPAAKAPEVKAAPVVLAAVEGEPLTNYVAFDMNGRHLPVTVNGTVYKSVDDRKALSAVVYGPVYTKDDLFVCTCINTVDAKNRALAGIRGRWNSQVKNGATRKKSLVRDVAAWVEVPVKSARV